MRRVSRGLFRGHRGQPVNYWGQPHLHVWSKHGVLLELGGQQISKGRCRLEPGKCRGVGRGMVGMPRCPWHCLEAVVCQPANRAGLAGPCTFNPN